MQHSISQTQLRGQSPVCRSRYTVLYAESCEPRAAVPLVEEVERLAIEYGGATQRQRAHSMLVRFDDAMACVQMAIALQRSMDSHRIRIGISTGDAGSAAAGAEKVVSVAGAGSVGISHATYALIRQDLDDGFPDCLLVEEHSPTELTHATLTPAPTAHQFSTFAGLGVL